MLQGNCGNILNRWQHKPSISILGNKLLGNILYGRLLKGGCGIRLGPFKCIAGMINLDRYIFNVDKHIFYLDKYIFNVYIIHFTIVFTVGF